MSKRNFKKFAAAALAATMVFGSAITAFADNSAVGEGSYEGGEIKYPILQVTLPTIPEDAYDYIADPNGLIDLTDGAHYDGATFTGDTGIYFQADNTKAAYSETSEALTVTNENAQDLDVTVKLEVSKKGDAIITYADSASFETEDTANKLYLAVGSVSGGDLAETVALSASGAATITTTVAGVPDNYEPKYVSGNGYTYEKKDDASGWNDCSFALTGALNKNAKWGDEVNFPEITVTWSYKEHSAAVYLDTLTISPATLSVTATLPEGVKVTKVELFKAGSSTATAMTSGTHYTLSAGKYTFKADALTNWKGGTLKFTYSDGKADVVTIQ